MGEINAAAARVARRPLLVDEGSGTAVALARNLSGFILVGICVAWRTFRVGKSILILVVPDAARDATPATLASPEVRTSHMGILAGGRSIITFIARYSFARKAAEVVHGGLLLTGRIVHEMIKSLVHQFNGVIDPCFAAENGSVTGTFVHITIFASGSKHVIEIC